MKSILVICNQPHIDVPLRRSLAHLVKSCQVEVVPDGYHAFDELAQKTFDLIIVDSEITGIDSLEMVESVEYIDPGVPVILMLKQEHKAMWGPARRLSAHPILRPFQAITFLRLIDTLLHEHLERYREMAESLQTLLEKLSAKIESTITFLVDAAGQPLIFTGPAEKEMVDMLGQLAAKKLAAQAPQNSPLLAPEPAQKDHTMYLTSVLENLYLAMIWPAQASLSAQMWQQAATTAKAVQTIFLEYAAFNTPNDPPAGDTEELQGDIHAARLSIPLKLDAEPTPEPPAESPPEEEEADQEDNVAVNWQIISDTSSVLTRLQDFCQIE